MKKIITIGLIGLASMAKAATPDRDWPSVLVNPILDVPMRDTAITRGPDGSYYLTGTLGEPDFENSRVIKLWKSTDLKKWDEVGVVWDISKAENLRNEDGGALWQSFMRFVPGRPEGEQYCRGIKQPELHQVGKDWYICYSINDQGTGLIKSTTGKPEGPYRHHARITDRGAHPSMFWDDPAQGGDGAVYWLTDGGWIAKLTDDLTSLAERPRLLQPKPELRNRVQSGMPVSMEGSPWMSDYPRQVGSRGVFMFKADGRYYLTAADDNPRLGVVCDDTFIAYSDKVYGPYSHRFPMVPHGGGITVFQGPNSTAVTEFRGPYHADIKAHVDGPQYYATFFGNDDRAIFRDRPGVVPLEWLGAKRWMCQHWAHVETLPRKPQSVFTVGGVYAHLKPLAIPGNICDCSILNAPDGFYYLTGSNVNDIGNLYIYRSKDLMKWEKIGPVWRYEDIEWLTNKEPKPSPDDPRFRQKEHARLIWDCEMEYADGKYYLYFNIMPRGWLPDDPEAGSGVLVSDKAEGPYTSLGRKGGYYTKDAKGGAPRIFTGADGKVLANAVQNWKPSVGKADFSKKEWRDWDFKPLDLGAGDKYAHDGWGNVHCVEGLYLYTTMHNQAPQPHWLNGMGGQPGRNFGNMVYASAKSPWGPYRNYKMVPSCEYGNPFKDKEGQWWTTVFFRSQLDPWWEHATLMPLQITRRGDELDVQLINSGWTKRQLKIMGGGDVAEVKTVIETAGE